MLQIVSACAVGCSSFYFAKGWHFVCRYVSVSMLQCRQIGLPITLFGLAKCGTFSTTLQSKHQSSNLAQMFIRSTSPRISPNRCCKQWFFVRSFCLSGLVCRQDLIFCEARGIFLFFFFCVGKASFFANFGLCVGLVRFANVLVFSVG